jgi:hypothetical protein
MIFSAPVILGYDAPKVATPLSFWEDDNTVTATIIANLQRYQFNHQDRFSMNPGR